jgi:Leucine-rich repeat (LRR) protein
MRSCTGFEEMPVVICKVICLRVLDISNNSFTMLPESIAMLVRLRDLNAGSNASLKSLPVSLCKLMQLQRLLLNRCSLGSNLEPLGQLLGLTHLDLSGNAALTKLPGSLGDLGRLRTLNLSNCTRLESVPLSISRLPWLRVLNTSGCGSLGCAQVVVVAPAQVPVSGPGSEDGVEIAKGKSYCWMLNSCKVC